MTGLIAIAAIAYFMRALCRVAAEADRQAQIQASLSHRYSDHGNYDPDADAWEDWDDDRC